MIINIICVIMGLGAGFIIGARWMVNLLIKELDKEKAEIEARKPRIDFK